jgi:ABC-type antimicrobial peptide transport system permease subunit
VVDPRRDLTEESKGTIYFPFSIGVSSLVVRTASDPHGFIAAVRDQVQAVDRNQPVYDVKTMDERIALSLSSRRFAVTLLTVFASLALLLAAIGLYGVIAYLVTQRTQEIGIRMALGAARTDILKLVIRHALVLSGVGLLIGVVTSIAVSRYLQTLLFEVPRIDAATLVGASVLLAATAIVAALIPARRASKVDPMVALRYQ